MSTELYRSVGLGMYPSFRSAKRGGRSAKAGFPRFCYGGQTWQGDARKALAALCYAMRCGLSRADLIAGRRIRSYRRRAGRVGRDDD